MNDINLGFQQQAFDFDQSHVRDLKEVLTFIDCWLADNDHVTLDQVANHFSIQPDKWSETYILELLNNLFQDDKIHFIGSHTFAMEQPFHGQRAGRFIAEVFQ